MHMYYKHVTLISSITCTEISHASISMLMHKHTGETELSN